MTMKMNTVMKQMEQEVTVRIQRKVIGELQEEKEMNGEVDIMEEDTVVKEEEVIEIEIIKMMKTIQNYF